MGEENLVTLEEVTAMLPWASTCERAEVKVTAHSHGEETNEMPIAIVVARHPGSAHEEP